MKSPLCCVVAITVALIYAPCPSPDAVYIPLVKVSMFSCLLLCCDPRLQAVLGPPLVFPSSWPFKRQRCFSSVCVSETLHLSRLFVFPFTD